MANDNDLTMYVANMLQTLYEAAGALDDAKLSMDEQTVTVPRDAWERLMEAYDAATP